MKRSLEGECALFEVSNLRVGGALGLNPTLLIGSIFYRGDKLLENEEGTSFNRERARIELEEAERLCEELALQFGVDVVFPSVKSVDSILPFMAEFESLVLFLDSPDPKARIRSYKFSRELGLEERVVVNGISVDTSNEELEAIRDSKIEAAVLLVFDPKNPYYSIMPESKLEILKKLLLLTEEAKISKKLVDIVVLDPGSLGLCALALRMVREKYRFPVGCAPANALGGVSKKLFSEAGATGIHSSTAAILRCYGADFIMYGPVRRIRYVAYALATTDSILATMRGLRTKSKTLHPLTKFFKKVQKTFTSPW